MLAVVWPVRKAGDERLEQENGHASFVQGRGDCCAGGWVAT